MAFSPLRSKTAFLNGRSLSLPSKLHHPSVSDFSESLSKIITSSSAEKTLSSLKILYQKIDDLLASPHTQQGLREDSANDRVLDACIRILDACGSTRDIVSKTRLDLQELLSAIRRKDEAKGVRRYRESRKLTRKALREVRIGFEKGGKRKGRENGTVYAMIREAESVSIAVFEFWVSYVDKEVGESRKRGWSGLVSRGCKKAEMEIEPSRLKEMESKIRVVEEELERLFRQLIRTRVCLLNILNH